MNELKNVRRSLRIYNKVRSKEKFLPDDLIIEILIRLPAQSVGRCKCVCKLWCSLIQDPMFTVKHLRRSNVVYVYEENTKDNGDKEIFKCLSSKDGILLETSNLTGKYRIRNPITKQVQDLPDPKGKRGCIGLFHLSEANYSNIKLANVYCKEGTEDGGCQVLTVGTDLAWRVIDCPHFYNLGGKGESPTMAMKIDRAWYVCRFFDDVGFGVSEVVCLEIHREHFSHIKIPQDIFPSFKHVTCNAWEDKFCLVSMEEQDLHALVLEDYEKQEWSQRKVVIPLSFYGEFPKTVHTLLPCSFSNDCYWFRRCDHSDFKYNIRTKQEYVYSPPPGKRYVYNFTPSLVSWKVNHPQGKHEKIKQYKQSGKLEGKSTKKKTYKDFLKK